MKLKIGLSKKLRLPDYGSVGASCHVEVELDGFLLKDGLLPLAVDKFRERE